MYLHRNTQPIAPFGSLSESPGNPECDPLPLSTERSATSSICLGVGLSAEFAGQLRPWLGAQQLRPYFVDGGAASEALLEQWRFEAILIDGERLRDSARLVEVASRRGRSIVVLFVADADEERQLEGLARGATEVIAKPASARLVAAKIRSLLDAPQAGEAGLRGELRFGPLSLNQRRGSARLGGRPLSLTRSEFNVLFLLASNPEDFVSRETIADVLAPRGAGKHRRSADMHVLRIRRKLEEAGPSNLYLEAGYGRGYRVAMTALLGSGRSNESSTSARPERVLVAQEADTLA